MPPAATIRSIVLNPARYLDQKVAITGQYSGRNLLGDMPDAPAKSRYDFALRSADAALWIVNMRPKMKDANGKDIELGLDARIDTGRWLTSRHDPAGTRSASGSMPNRQPHAREAAERNDRRGTDPRAGRAAARGRFQRADAGRNRRLDRDDRADSVLAGHRSGDAEGERFACSYSRRKRRTGRTRTPSADFTFQYSGANRVAGAAVHQAARAVPHA